MNQREFNDLVEHAQKRTRESAMLVTQLLDTDAAKASMLLSIAYDFVNGSAAYLYEGDVDADDPMSEKEALASVVVMLLRSLGVDVVEAALKQMQRSKRQ